MSDEFPKWNVEFGSYSFENVEFRQNGSELNIYRKSQDGIRDREEDLCYELDITVMLPRLSYMSTGCLEFEGYVSEVKQYPEGESIPVLEEFCDGGKYCKVGEVHDRSDKYLPPRDKSFKPGVKLLTLRDY